MVSVPSVVFLVAVDANDAFALAMLAFYDKKLDQKDEK